MSDSLVAITIVWVLLFIYVIAGAIDFGAGFWAMVYKKRGTEAILVANKFLSPSWKVTNVFLVMFVVVLVGFFPHAVYLLGTVLLLPAGLVLILLIIRSSLMVFSQMIEEYSGLMRIVSGLTGLLIPALLISVLPISLGGFIQVVDGHPELLFGKLLLSWTEYAHIAFGISSELFLSALFLASYAEESGRKDAYQYYRKCSLYLGPFTLITAIIVAATYTTEAAWMTESLMDVGPYYAASATLFVIGYSALWWRGKPGYIGKSKVAVILVVLQYLVAIFAYGAAHYPYMVYPVLTVEQAFTNPIIYRELLIGIIIMVALLVPVFVWFWKLFFKDPKYLTKD